MLESTSKEFLEVIETNKGIIYKVANSYCKSEEDKKDLIQEIIIQLWRSFHKYNDQFKRSTWMYRIALNVAISFYRKAVSRKKIAMPISDKDMVSIKEDDPKESDPALAQLQKFITELKEFDRALILLYLEEKSQKEIADILGITSSNVSTRIVRIKEKLRKRFLKIKSH